MGRHASRTPRRREPRDPLNSADPRVRAVVAGLRSLPPSPGPRPQFRDELRMQLVAVAPRLISEGGDAAAVTTRPATRAPARSFRSASPARRPGRLRAHTSVRSDHRSLHRPLGVLAGAFTVLVALLAGAVWLSTSARPGDALYGLKRASENVQLNFTDGSSKGRALLAQASERATEVSNLVARPSAMALGPGVDASGGISAQTASLISSTLASADSDLRHGTSLITSHAVATRTRAGLVLVHGWTPAQISTLQSALARVPAGSTHDRIASSIVLVQQADARARALLATLALPCQAGAAHDQFGPVPVAGCASAAPSATTAPAVGHRAPSTPTTPAAVGSATPRPSSAPAGSTAPSSGRTAGTARTAAPAVTTGTGTATSPGGLPVSVGSCGVSAGLGPIQISLGSCPSS